MKPQQPPGAPYGAVVTGVGTYLPPRIVTNADLERLVDTTDEWITTRTGIRQRRVLGDGMATSDMAVEAGRKALEAAGLRPEQVGLVVLATFTPDYVFPATACLVQDRLGLVNAGAFDLEAACTGFVYALSSAAQFVSAGAIEHVLVIGSDYATRLVDWQDRSTCVIFGDGAAAVTVSRSANTHRGVLSSYLRSDGSGWRHLHQPAGGTRQPPTVETVRERLHYIKMDGRETFKFAARAMAQAAVETTGRAGLSMEDIDLLVPHQANLRIIEMAVERLGLAPSKVVLNIDRYGNTVAASIGIALEEALGAGRVKDDDILLLVGSGAGLTWGGICLRWGT